MILNSERKKNLLVLVSVQGTMHNRAQPYSSTQVLRLRFELCIVNHIELGDILVQSMHIVADSGWHIG